MPGGMRNANSLSNCPQPVLPCMTHPLSLGPPLALPPPNPFSNRRKLSRYPLPFFGSLLSRSLIVDGDRRRRRCVRNGSPHLVNRSWTRASPRARSRETRQTFLPDSNLRPRVRVRPTISAQIPSLTIYGLSRAFFLLLSSPLLPIPNPPSSGCFAVALGK